MKVFITLTDVEPAVRLNALLEGAGAETVLASPLDDVRGMLARERPDVLVLTGALADPFYLSIARAQLWEGGAVVGLADVGDPVLRDRLREMGFAEVFAKPVPPEELFAAVQRVLDRERLARETGLIGQSEAIREVLVQVEQMA
ncbi:MAG TPA: hypothetical protein VFX39_00520, partial [Gemmatimonadaceae bacterium]|nr:hypothetical protein [Gemmatimonadaceae bacterium]